MRRNYYIRPIVAMVSRVLGRRLIVMVRLGRCQPSSFCLRRLRDRMVDTIPYLSLDTYVDGILDSFFPWYVHGITHLPYPTYHTLPTIPYLLTYITTDWTLPRLLPLIASTYHTYLWHLVILNVMVEEVKLQNVDCVLTFLCCPHQSSRNIVPLSNERNNMN